MRDVRAIARLPHPLASAEHERVREYIVARLRELGANPEVQTLTVALHTPFGPETWAVVRNILSRIPGSVATPGSAGVPPLKSTGAVMMVANYDSVPSGPGAGDDAASVAAILDTIRALKVSRQLRKDLRNDLIVLFTDGEANGMLGAKGFLETYPALREVKVVLNFDNRGDQGPSMLFQASARDSWLVDHFADAAPFPRGASEIGGSALPEMGEG
jgi:Zn-dependent M28 family amino/carboxypeptidase